MSMLKRTIEISGWGYHLAGRGKHLRLVKNAETVGSVPFEDLGVLLLDTTGATITTSALVQTADQGGVTVLCGKDHLPVAIVQPLSGNALSTQRLLAQTALSKPMRSALWAHVVRSKILGQAAALDDAHPSRQRLLRLSKEVQPADKGHCEAQAARVYWRAIFEDHIDRFRRQRDEPGANAMLNYGYAAMRAAMARSLCAAGLQPALGLQHHSRSNPFCLADDFVEPFRPLIDRAVVRLIRRGKQEIDQEAKRTLLETLTHSISVGGHNGPVSVAMQRVAHSYAEIALEEAEPRPRQSGAPRSPAATRAQALILPWIA